MKIEIIIRSSELQAWVSHQRFSWLPHGLPSGQGHCHFCLCPRERRPHRHRTTWKTGEGLSYPCLVLSTLYILTNFWKEFIVSCYAKSNSRFSFIAISCNQHLKTGYLFINLNLLAKWMRKFIFMGHAVCKFRFSVKIEMTSKHFLHV